MLCKRDLQIGDRVAKPPAMKLQKLDFRPKVLRKEEMLAVIGGGNTYCVTNCSSTYSKGGGATTDCGDAAYD